MWPKPGIYTLGMLDYMNGKIKTCSGCKRNLKKKVKDKFKPQPPPDNLVIATNGIRVFRKRGTREKDSEPGNMYYHLDCVKMYGENFGPSDLIEIPPTLMPHLRECHILKLKTLGFM